MSSVESERQAELTQRAAAAALSQLRDADDIRIARSIHGFTLPVLAPIVNKDLRRAG
jgi:hypothetical protein